MKATPLMFLGLIVVLLSGSGCSRRLIFATHTSLGLNISGTAQMPNKVALDYSRYEVALVPRQTNGEAQPVYGGLDADISLLRGNHIIREAFATGDAAEVAAEAKSFNEVKGQATEGKGTPTRALFFMSGTTYGVNMNVGEQATPPNLVVGYQRHTATVIPVATPEQRVGSVYADVAINTTDPEDVRAPDGAAAPAPSPAPASAIRGTRIRQFFATGLAAKKLAEETPVRRELRELAGRKAVETFLTEQQKQEDLIQNIRRLYHAQPGGQAKIRQKAVALGLAKAAHTDALDFLADLDRKADGSPAHTTLLTQLRDYARDPQ